MSKLRLLWRTYNTMKRLDEMNFVPEPYQRFDSNNMEWTLYCIYWKLDIQTIEDRSRYRIFDASTGNHYTTLTPIEAQAVVYELLKEMGDGDGDHESGSQPTTVCVG
jgi:hypothetical protein